MFMDGLVAPDGLLWIVCSGWLLWVVCSGWLLWIVCSGWLLWVVCSGWSLWMAALDGSSYDFDLLLCNCRLRDRLLALRVSEGQARACGLWLPPMRHMELHDREPSRVLLDDLSTTKNRPLLRPSVGVVPHQQ